jgi:hypothetical protein
MTHPIDPMAHIRQEIMAQPAGDRAEYALELLAFYLDPQPRFFEGCAALGIALTLPDLRVLFTLDRRRGRPVSMDALVAARYIDQPVDDWGTHDKAVRAIARIRPQLKAKGLPVAIEWNGLGYVLTASEGFRFEDAAAPDLFSVSGVRG